MDYFSRKSPVKYIMNQMDINKHNLTIFICDTE